MSTPYACMQLPIPANYRNIQGSPSELLVHGTGTPFPPPTFPRALQSDTDGVWYFLNGVNLGAGVGTLSCAQLPTPAGSSPFVVLLNSTDGLHYKLQLTGVPPDVFWTVDETPTGAAAEVYTVTDGVTTWTVTLVTDGGLTVRLT